jgi:hypothetical protein
MMIIQTSRNESLRCVHRASSFRSLFINQQLTQIFCKLITFQLRRLSAFVYVILQGVLDGFFFPTRQKLQKHLLIVICICAYFGVRWSIFHCLLYRIDMFICIIFSFVFVLYYSQVLSAGNSLFWRCMQRP